MKKPMKSRRIKSYPPVTKKAVEDVIREVAGGMIEIVPRRGIPILYSARDIAKVDGTSVWIKVDIEGEEDDQILFSKIKAVRAFSRNN